MNTRKYSDILNALNIDEICPIEVLNTEIDKYKENPSNYSLDKLYSIEKNIKNEIESYTRISNTITSNIRIINSDASLTPQQQLDLTNVFTQTNKAVEMEIESSIAKQNIISNILLLHKMTVLVFRANEKKRTTQNKVKKLFTNIVPYLTVLIGVVFYFMTIKVLEFRQLKLEAIAWETAGTSIIITEIFIFLFTFSMIYIVNVNQDVKCKLSGYAVFVSTIVISILTILPVILLHLVPLFMLITFSIITFILIMFLLGYSYEIINPTPIKK